MVRKLTTHVHLDGTWYKPGDSPPGEVAARITNPDVWDVPAEVDVRKPGDGIEIPETPRTVKVEQAEVVKQPPRSGPGSGGPAWIEFAASKGVTEKFDSKGALISELENRGLIEKE
jgi:hypothetical protein